MSRHLNASPDQIAKYVLMAGDPRRTTRAAQKFLEKVKLVSTNRGALIYTGFYKGIRFSFATSGMGATSMSTYAWELYNDYKVEAIIRIGTTGGYGKNTQIFDIYNPHQLWTQNNLQSSQWNLTQSRKPSLQLYELINQTAKLMGIKIKNAKVHSTDMFYTNPTHFATVWKKYGCEIVEMELVGLWGVSSQLNKHSAALLMVSDLIYNRETKKIQDTTFDERVQKTDLLWKIGLETFVNWKKRKK